MQMRRKILSLATGLVAVGTIRAGVAQEPVTSWRLDFERDKVGDPPGGFSVALTGAGPPPRWVVVNDSNASTGTKVLAQTSTDRTDNRFPLAILEQPLLADLAISVRFRPVGGHVDQAAGLALRLTNANNYYVVRANALENNVRFYRVVAGKRVQIAGKDARVLSGAWQELGIEARGSRFAISLGGKPLFEASDTTFALAGRVALWTKSDSVSHFDDLAIRKL